MLQNKEQPEQTVTQLFYSPSYSNLQGNICIHGWIKSQHFPQVEHIERDWKECSSMFRVKLKMLTVHFEESKWDSNWSVKCMNIRLIQGLKAGSIPCFNTHFSDMITHLEPDILEFEIKWSLGSISTSKASGDYGIPVELFHVLKDDAVKVLCSKCQ